MFKTTTKKDEYNSKEFIDLLIITKIWMLHSFSGRDSLSVIVLQQFVKKVERLGSDQMLILGVHKSLPPLLRVSAENVIKARIELNVVLLNVLEELVGAEHLGDSHQLIVVVMAVKEWLFSEDQARQHAAEAPHVERVVVVLVIDQQFRAFEVSRCHANVIFLTWMVELG